jgi:membrane fusion protein (multidrug efflux system)
MVTTANLLPTEEVELKSNISGQVMQINFKEGQTVKKGQSLINLDDRQWQAELVGLKAELLALEKNYERKEALLKVEGSSQQELEQAIASIASIKAAIQKLEVNIDLARIKAPFSGVVGMRNFSEGSYLSVGESITILTKLDELKVDFSLPENLFSSVDVNQELKVVVNNDTLTATIYAITSRLDVSSRTFNVRAILKQPKIKILPGTYAEVLVKKDKQDNALLVPTQAVVPQINEQTIYVLKNGIPEKRNVILGSRTANMVNILDGIHANDTVVITGLLQIKEGSPVTILTVQK